MNAETVSVIIATFGDKHYWNKLASRAVNSVIQQSVRPHQLIRSHGNNLHEARNEAAKKSYSDWLCFLDADDELEPGYLEAMLAGKGDLRYPRVRYIDHIAATKNYTPEAVALQEIPLLSANFMVVGTFVRREQFLRVGGFPDYPAYEDWALWLACWIDGAQYKLCQDAIYRAHRRKDSRNHMPGHVAQQLHDQIVARYRPMAQEKGLVK